MFSNFSRLADIYIFNKRFLQKMLCVRYIMVISRGMQRLNILILFWES